MLDGMKIFDTRKANNSNRTGKLVYLPFSQSCIIQADWQLSSIVIEALARSPVASPSDVHMTACHLQF